MASCRLKEYDIFLVLSLSSPGSYPGSHPLFFSAVSATHEILGGTHIILLTTGP